MMWFPVTSSHRHFIFWVTSYQREKWSFHTRHLIQVHYIPCGTSYKSHFIPVHFIPRPLHTSHVIPIVTSYHASLHTEATSYQCTSYKGQFISVHFIPKSPHTRHFIPKSLHTKVKSPTSYHTVHFILVISYRSLYTSPWIQMHFI